MEGMRNNEAPEVRDTMLCIPCRRGPRYIMEFYLHGAPAAPDAPESTPGALAEDPECERECERDQPR